MLFGIERGVRALFMMLGRYVDAASTPSRPHPQRRPCVFGRRLLAIIGGTVILFSERELASRWGAKFLYAENGSDPIEKRHALVDRCDDISKEKGLSAREQEVLLLLAQHKTISDIENELIVANGTVKAIYAIFTKSSTFTRAKSCLRSWARSVRKETNSQ